MNIKLDNVINYIIEAIRFSYDKEHCYKALILEPPSINDK